MRPISKEEISMNSLVSFEVDLELYEDVKDDRYDLSYVTQVIVGNVDIERLQEHNKVLPIKDSPELASLI